MQNKQKLSINNGTQIQYNHCIFKSNNTPFFDNIDIKNEILYIDRFNPFLIHTLHILGLPITIFAILVVFISNNSTFMWLVDIYLILYFTNTNLPLKLKLTNDSFEYKNKVYEFSNIQKINFFQKIAYIYDENNKKYSTLQFKFQNFEEQYLFKDIVESYPQYIQINFIK